MQLRQLLLFLVGPVKFSSLIYAILPTRTHNGMPRCSLEIQRLGDLGKSQFAPYLQNHNFTINVQNAAHGFLQQSIPFTVLDA